MSTESLGSRFWRAFVGRPRPYVPPKAVRGRDGYTLWQRFWASFINRDLPPAGVVLDAPRLAPVGVPGRSPSGDAGRGSGAGPKPGWFALPPLPRVSGLTAKGTDAVVLEASAPDGLTKFLVRAQGVDEPEFSLELVLLDVDVTTPVVSAVRYPTADGGEQVLLVPVVRGPFGHASSLVRLSGFGIDSAAGWTAEVPTSVTSRAAWDDHVIVPSVRAALNEATRDAWRQVRELLDERAARVIDGELSR